MATSPQRLPWILVTLLVALNVLVLVLVWFRPAPAPPPHHSGKGGPGDPGGPGGLEREIGLTEAEAERLKPLKEAHFAKLDSLQAEIVKFRIQAFAQFGEPGADTIAALAALNQIGAAQIAIEKERYHHFHDVLLLCTPEQAMRFQELMPKLLARRNQPENDPRHRGPHDGPPR